MLASARATERGGLTSPVELREVIFKAPVAISETPQISIVLAEHGGVVHSENREVVDVASVAMSRRGWQELADGWPQIDEVEKACSSEVNLANFYRDLETEGVCMGPRFRVLSHVRCNNGSAVCDLKLPEVDLWEHALQLPHWSLVDGAFQLLGVLGHGVAGVCVPFRLAECWLTEVPCEGHKPQLVACARLKAAEIGMIRGDVALATSTGKVVAMFKDIVARSNTSVPAGLLPSSSDLYKVLWQKQRECHSRRFNFDTVPETQDGACFTKALDGTHVVVMPCWAEKEAEDQVEDLKSHAEEMLRILQDSAKSMEAYCVVIAGIGAFAEACFSSLASMLRSAQCEVSMQVQAWFQTRIAGRPCDLRFCSPRCLPFLQQIHHKYMTCKYLIYNRRKFRSLTSDNMQS